MPASHPDPLRRRSYGRQVLLLSAGHLLAFVDRTKIVGLMPTIRRQIAMTDTQAGWVIGASFAVGYAVSILAASLADRRPARRDRIRIRLCVGIALWGTASLMTGLAGSVGALIAVRVLVGAGQALFIPAAVSRLSIEGDAIGAGVGGLSRFTAAASLGRSTGLLAVAAALAAIGAFGASPYASWRWVFVLTAIPNLVLLSLIARRGGGSSRPAPAPAPAAAAPSMGHAGASRFLYLSLAILPFILTQALGGWLPTLFTADRGVGTQVGATWVGGIVLVAGTSSQLVAGWFLQRAGRWRPRAPVLIAGALAATIPMIVLTGWGAGNVAATVGAVAASLTLGFATFAALFGWQRLIPERERLAANGAFFALVTVVGVGVGPLSTGMLVDHGLTLRGALVAMTVVLAAVAAVLAGVTQRLIRRTAAA